MKRINLDFKLYLITDRKLLTHNCSLLTAVKEALKGGVKAVQLREKDMGTRELLTVAYRMRALTKKYGAKLFINDRLDIARAVGADGVHLTQNSIPAHAVRSIVKKKLSIGVSTHSLREAREAEKGGADFITLGPIYKTPSKLKFGRPPGITTLKNVTKSIKIPVFAIGGIKISTIRDVGKAGAYGISMISEVFKAEDIQGKTREIIKKVRESMSKEVRD